MSRPVLLGMPQKQAEWASVGAAIVEPLKSEKQLGWVVDEEPPAPWFNWWQKRMWALQRLFLSMVPLNLFVQPDVSPAAAFLYSILYHPGVGGLVVHDGTSIYRSINGALDWTNVATPATLTNQSRTGAIDSNRYIIGIDHAGPGMQALESANGIVYNVKVIDAAVAENVTAIGTGEYGVDDKIIVGGSAGTIRFASSILGAFQTPTTPPGVASACVSIRKIGSQWFLLLGNGNHYVTNDDGDNWAATAQKPQDAVPAAAGWSHMASATGSDYGRLVAVGDVAPFNSAIAYSDDQGATWVAATLDIGSAIVDFKLKAVYYLGAEVWIATGIKFSVSDFFTIMSTDGGHTWHSVDIANTASIVTTSLGLTDIAVDERRIWLMGDLNDLVRSIGMASALTP